MKNSPRAPLGYRFKVTGRSRKCGSRMTCALVTRPCGKSILSKLETGTFRPSMVRYCLAFGYFGLRRVPGLFTLAKTLFEHFHEIHDFCGPLLATATFDDVFMARTFLFDKFQHPFG